MSSGQPVTGPAIKYSQQYRRCGKPGCPTCTPPKPGHGPYWYAYWWEDGRVRSRYLGKNAPPQVQASVPATAGTLRVQTLGGFTVWRVGEQMPAGSWNRRKVAALFKCLLAAPGYRLHREQILDLLFPDLAFAEAAKGLRSTVYLLRKLLDDHEQTRSHLRWEGDVLQLVPALTGQADANWLDATAFEQAALTALHSREAAVCRSALDLYRGEYLPEDRYAESTGEPDLVSGRQETPDHPG